MPRERQSFRVRDLRAAIKAVQAAGVSVARYEVTKDGRIVIVPGEPCAPAVNPDIDPEQQAYDEDIDRA